MPCLHIQSHTHMGTIPVNEEASDKQKIDTEVEELEFVTILLLCS